jgi:hypothetical protein
MTVDLTRLIKPLVWARFGSECLRAESTLGRFEIMWGFHNGQVSLDVPKERRHHSWHPDIADAQAAANADNVARVLAAIDTALVKELVEALRAISETSNYTRASWMQDTARAALIKLKGPQA